VCVCGFRCEQVEVSAFAIGIIAFASFIACSQTIVSERMFDSSGTARLRRAPPLRHAWLSRAGDPSRAMLLQGAPVCWHAALSAAGARAAEQMDPSPNTRPSHGASPASRNAPTADTQLTRRQSALLLHQSLRKLAKLAKPPLRQAPQRADTPARGPTMVPASTKIASPQVGARLDGTGQTMGCTPGSHMPPCLQHARAPVDARLPTALCSADRSSPPPPPCLRAHAMLARCGKARPPAPQVTQFAKSLITNACVACCAHARRPTAKPYMPLALPPAPCAAPAGQRRCRAAGGAHMPGLEGARARGTKPYASHPQLPTKVFTLSQQLSADSYPHRPRPFSI